jgi:hypothetical protein
MRGTNLNLANFTFG